MLRQSKVWLRGLAALAVVLAALSGLTSTSPSVHAQTRQSFCFVPGSNPCPPANNLSCGNVVCNQNSSGTYVCPGGIAESQTSPTFPIAQAKVENGSTYVITGTFNCHNITYCSGPCYTQRFWLYYYCVDGRTVPASIQNQTVPGTEDCTTSGQIASTTP